jgi:phosphatidylserine/phosphatidylglycerophosphate/cardiolipin synthase-like enzyme
LTPPPLGSVSSDKERTTMPEPRVPFAFVVVAIAVAVPSRLHAMDKPRHNNGAQIGELSAHMSPYAKGALARILAEDRDGQLLGRTWNVSTGNRLVAHGDRPWLLQSPGLMHWGTLGNPVGAAADCNGKVGCNEAFKYYTCDGASWSACTDHPGYCVATAVPPGADKRKMCIGHSDVLWDAMYEVIAGANEWVDITTLVVPNGRFAVAIKEALKVLAARAAKNKKTITVRIMFGEVWGARDGEKIYDSMSPTELANWFHINVWDGEVKRKWERYLQLKSKSSLPEAEQDELGSIDAEFTRWSARSLVEGLAPREGAGQLKIYVGSIATSKDSWNHSKIVAADGHAVIVGGHNLLDQIYLDKEPVHDLSLRIDGPAALDGHSFADQLWGYVCRRVQRGSSVTVGKLGNGAKAGDVSHVSLNGINMNAAYYYAFGENVDHDALSDPSQCPSRAQISDEQERHANDGALVIGLGRLGTMDAHERLDEAKKIQKSNRLANVSDGALLGMLEQAEHTIEGSLQDIGPIVTRGMELQPWPTELLALLDRLMMREHNPVNVHLVMSDVDGQGGRMGALAGYQYGHTFQAVLDKFIAAYTTQHPGHDADQAIRRALCQHLRLAPIRFNDQESHWPDVEHGQPVQRRQLTLGQKALMGDVPSTNRYGNHSKMMMVDGQAFYIGSQNFYVSPLQEFGYIVDDKPAADTLRRDFWSHVWRYSSRVAVPATAPDGDLQGCSLLAHH